MSIYKRFGVANAEIEGLWVDVDSMSPVDSAELETWLADPETSGVLLARPGEANKRFMIEAARQAKRVAIENGKPRAKKRKDPEKMNEEEIVDGALESARSSREIFGRSCIRDWRGRAFVGPDGNPLPWSEDAAAKVCVDLPDFFAILSRIAEETENYRKTSTEEVEKN